ncbi:MAG: nicotinate (nicotinamide) nucleotide adenylyltransferase, partial [Chloroflexi bacterium]|nr:nicotinate (nicotinamide) nucleotide adenylyltransferase [Chloroflexota bacterium]
MTALHASPSTLHSPPHLGLFGGTFDPPHLGHLILAEEACARLRLDRLLWVLTAQPPHKQDWELSPLADRLALVQAAIEGEPRFALSRVDIDRPGPHWAADTLRLVGQANPGAALIYLMGGDSLRDLPTWGRPAEFVARCTEIGVMRRSKTPLAGPGQQFDLAALEAALPGLASKVRFLDLPMIDIASHDVRRRVREGRPYR